MGVLGTVVVFELDTAAVTTAAAGEAVDEAAIGDADADASCAATAALAAMKVWPAESVKTA